MGNYPKRNFAATMALNSMWPCYDFYIEKACLHIRGPMWESDMQLAPGTRGFGVHPILPTYNGCSTDTI